MGDASGSHIMNTLSKIDELCEVSSVGEVSYFAFQKSFTPLNNIENKERLADSQLSSEREQERPGSALSPMSRLWMAM